MASWLQQQGGSSRTRYDQGTPGPAVADATAHESAVGEPRTAWRAGGERSDQQDWANSRAMSEQEKLYDIYNDLHALAQVRARTQRRARSAAHAAPRTRGG
jgi:hypothetical protein